MFVTALVGIYTIEDLWNKFGDLRMSFVSRFARQVLAFSSRSRVWSTPSAPTSDTGSPASSAS